MTAPRTVITGAAGFIGSHLCDFYLARGHEVTGIDNFLSGSRENLAHLRGGPRFRFVEHDVTEPLHLDGPVDTILHFASPASPIDFERIPIEVLRAGSHGTQVMLELACAKNARLLLASTSEVYGDPKVHPQPESYWGNVNPIGIRGVYDEAKRFAEALTMAYHRVRGLSTRIVRIFNTYGPRMRLDDGRALPTFFAQALKNEPIPIFGDGTQTRSFCYVDDLIQGIDRLLASSVTDPVNLGNPHEIPILALAREIIEVTGSRSEIVFHPLPPDDPKVRRPDITRARTLLAWEPTTDRRAGLEKSLPYFRDQVAR